ncbi:MAG: hypothetical protein H6641_00205 [Caldilineaceae bacterium]|nr:hypothetical protein [Caldilineaceae bacterium]
MMSQYELPVLVKRWAQEAVTVEQTIGQILLYLEDILERLQRLEQQARSSHSAETDNGDE